MVLRKTVVGEIRGMTVDASAQTEEPEKPPEAELEPPPPITEEKVKGTHIPVGLRGLMKTYPKTMRIPSLIATLKLALTVYLDKVSTPRIGSSRIESKGGLFGSRTAWWGRRISPAALLCHSRVAPCVIVGRRRWRRRRRPSRQRQR